MGKKKAEAVDVLDEPTPAPHPPIPDGATFFFDDQDKPFAGDTFMERDFLAMKEKHGIKTIVETGTCYGSTALWFADHFDKVITCESHPPTYEVAKERLKDRPNVDLRYGLSQHEVAKMIASIEGPAMFFLDAHFERHCPLLEELKAIAQSGLTPVLAIHDFQVPARPDLGFDKWNGQAFTFSWIKPALEAIYGNRYGFHYNNEATGQKRGCIYVFPV